jgi:hypothetical protein
MAGQMVDAPDPRFDQWENASAAFADSDLDEGP